MQQLADLGWFTWVSYEPALGPVDFWDWFPREVETSQTTSSWVNGIRWLVVGGESGPGARPFDLAWARSIVAQCKAAGVPCFVKQMGAKPILDCPAGEQEEGQFRDDGSARYWTLGFIKDKKGGDITEWPEDLRVREFPAVSR
jgi:protein gp37